MITVRRAVGQDVEVALRLLLQHVSDDEREEQLRTALGSAGRGELVLDDLLLAHHGHRAVGAMLTIVQPGATASIWPPETENNADDVADALTQAAISHLAAAEVVIIQSILEHDDRDGAAILARKGVKYWTDVVFMGRALDHPWPPDAHPPLEFVGYDEATHKRFVSLLEQSYQATLDCPELDGVRSPEQALAAHRASGEFSPAFWRLYRIDGVDAGILLLSPHPDQRAWELVYMGVASGFRGKGLGRQMLTNALPQLPRTDGEMVFLAVDRRNRYARETYTRLGFSEVATRALHLLLRR